MVFTSKYDFSKIYHLYPHASPVADKIITNTIITYFLPSQQAKQFKSVFLPATIVATYQL